MFLAYLIGSIPTGLWLGRLTKGVDVRTQGSGNIGATNVFRVLGAKLGVTVLVLDAFKGALPVILLPAILGIRPPTAFHDVMIGFAAILGHVFSLFLDFRGGKGVATALGVFLAVSPSPTLITLLLAIIILARWGYVSAMSCSGAVLLPVMMFLLGENVLILFVTSLLALVIIVRHRANLIRILKGTESRIWDHMRRKADEMPIPHTNAGGAA